MLLFFNVESAKITKQKSNNNPHITGLKKPTINMEITAITKMEGKK